MSGSFEEAPTHAFDDEPTHALDGAPTHVDGTTPGETVTRLAPSPMAATALQEAPTRTAPIGQPPGPRAGTILVAQGSTAPVAPDDPRSVAPRSFDARYLAGKLLGEGGMGEVRLAHDEVVGRDVAVKTIRPEIARDGDVRFLREARVQGQLEHPAVVPVYDLGTTDDGRLFFTMKRVRGEALDTVVERLAAGDADVAARFPARRLLTAFTQLCLAIEYAHTRGVLHRDLKPGNVMLGAFGEVHVLDWGLAKIRGHAEPPPHVGDTAPAISASGDRATLDGAVLGTPGYMPPEQAGGQLHALDARTDVYALGAILYELVALEPLHAHFTVMARLAAAFRELDPPLEARRSAERVPPELLAIVKRATLQDPNARFPSARELGAAVERYLDGERDELQRKELAAGHLRHARELAAASSSQPEALRELGRALALDPSDPGALTLLHALLAAPPDEIPEAARAELDALERERTETVLRMARARAFAWVAFAPLYVLIGVTSWARLGTVLALVLANAGLAAHLHAKRRADTKVIYVSLVSSTICVASLSSLYGALVLAPVYAITNAITYALTGNTAVRVASMKLSVAAFAVPAIASFVGLDAAALVQGPDGTLILRSPMVATPLGPTLAILFLSFLVTTMTPSFLVGGFSQRLATAERRAVLQAHHLRNLLPKG